MNSQLVECAACSTVYDLSTAEAPDFRDGWFVGGCPTCHGEFYETTLERTHQGE